MTYLVLSIALATAILVSYIINYIFQSLRSNENKGFEINLHDNWVLPISNEERKKESKKKDKSELMNPIQNLTKYNHNVFRDRSGRFRSNKELK